VDRVVLQNNDRDLLIEMTSGMTYRTTRPETVHDLLKQHLNPDQITSEE
jgi:hypothetical protein